MRSTKGSLVGLVLAGILAVAPVAAFGHGGGGGGHGGGGGGFGGGHFGGGGGHFGGLGGHFAGPAGHSFAGHSFAGRGFAEQEGAHFARHGDHFRHEGDFFFGDPSLYGYDYPYYGYYDDNSGIVLAVQQELTQLGYYHGPVDGVIAAQTEAAIRWFQSVDKLPVTGQIDYRTLKALGIS